MTDYPAQSSDAPLTRGEKNFPFYIVVRESENNMEHLRSRGAPSGIFLSRHISFDISRVVISSLQTLEGLYDCLPR